MTFYEREHINFLTNLVINDDHKPPTHSFYQNFLLDHHQPAYPLPYAVRIKNGVVVSCPDEHEKVWGPSSANNSSKFFWQPFKGSISLTCDRELNLKLDKLSSFFVNIELISSIDCNSFLRVPLSRGSGFITGLYSYLKPILKSELAFESPLPQSIDCKQLLNVNDGSSWLVYSWPPIKWQRIDMHTLIPDQTTSDTYSGIIQIAKLPPGNDDRWKAEKVYDSHCGNWSEGIELNTSFDENELGTYTFSHKKAFNDKPILFHILSHHLDYLTLSEDVKMQPLSLDTPSHGKSYGVSSTNNEYRFYEFLPRLSLIPKNVNINGNERQWLYQTVIKEMNLDWVKEIETEPSIYFAGKLVGKFANILVVANSVLKDQTLTNLGIEKLIKSLDILLGNERQFPLIYDTTYGGIISSAAHVTGDPMADFGSSYYNDVHFHAAYPVYAGSVLASLQNLPDVLQKKLSIMIQSVNSTKSTTKFCAYRTFDWYVGHSWAHGLMASADGKDEESTSEAAHFYYSSALFSEFTGDVNQSKVSRLQLSVMKDSTQSYRLLDDSNTVMPLQWKGNRVGICFENKRDYTTWFSPNIECIHGIHMLPLSPITSYIRNPDFISQEFESHLRQIFPTNTNWDSIIILNWAFSNNPYAAPYVKQFFETAADHHMDPGLSRSFAWVLASSNEK